MILRLHGVVSVRKVAGAPVLWLIVAGFVILIVGFASRSWTSPVEIAPAPIIPPFWKAVSSSPAALD